MDIIYLWLGLFLEKIVRTPYYLFIAINDPCPRNPINHPHPVSSVEEIQLIHLILLY